MPLLLTKYQEAYRYAVHRSYTTYKDTYVLRNKSSDRYIVRATYDIPDTEVVDHIVFDDMSEDDMKYAPSIAEDDKVTEAYIAMYIAKT